MLKKLLNYLEDKKIIILGFGIEGQESYYFLRNHFPEKQLFIADRKTDLLEKFPYLMEDANVEVSLGENYLNGIEEYDVILKAPGISLKDIDISKFQDKITSQLELFLEYVNIFSIGITGTKGKSTTTTLMYQILKQQDKDAFLLGNIGNPIFRELDNMKKDSIAVIELSSHALEYVKKSPNISILLNIYEEHLDHYESLEKYIDAKFNIAKYQNDKNYFIYNYDNEIMNNYKFKYKENDYAISLNEIYDKSNSIFLKNGNIYCNNEVLCSSDIEMNLKGLHIVNNIMFIFAVCKILDLNFEKVLTTIKCFKPLEHRMEYVGKFDEIDFYNDSIATIPESTINSIKAIKDVNTLIIGGKDRGVNLTSVINFLLESNVKNIVCLPKTGEYIYNALLNSDKKVYKADTMEEAVRISKKITEKNKVCLLSPAASSYGFFKNFEERGNLFKKYIKEI